MILSFSTFSVQTDGSVPNTLVIANCEVVKRRVAAAEHISQVMCLHISHDMCYSIFLAIISFANCCAFQLSVTV